MSVWEASHFQKRENEADGISEASRGNCEQVYQESAVALAEMWSLGEFETDLKHVNASPSELMQIFNLTLNCYAKGTLSASESFYYKRFMLSLLRTIARSLNKSLRNVR